MCTPFNVYKKKEKDKIDLVLKEKGICIKIILRTAAQYACKLFIFET